MPAQFSITALIQKADSIVRLRHILAEHVCDTHWIQSVDVFLDVVTQSDAKTDCLIIDSAFLSEEDVFHQLKSAQLLFPAVVWDATDKHAHSKISSKAEQPLTAAGHQPDFSDYPSDYHSAVVYLTADKIERASEAIRQAIDNFLKLPTPKSHQSTDENSLDHRAAETLNLASQQQRLAEKLKERLGYMGIYYKRDPHIFFKRMTLEQKEELLGELREIYREIILQYFSPADSNNSNGSTNSNIDNYVNSVFFADIPVAQVVEIHMELMDEFSKQLNLEGRNEDILLDYRLTLIDVIAHLCEMYRRSIPREDINPD
ncbi:MAG: circadian clock protein KaiA [Cyanobacteria bacterium P01_H01_bin.119]